MTEVTQKGAQATVELADSDKMKALAESIKTNYMNPTVWGQIVGMSKTLFESHALPKHLINTAQVVMQLQAGFEMGMKPIESLQSLYMVNGAINVWGKAVPRRLREHGYNIKYTNESNEACTAIVTGAGREKYEETFKFQDAVDSGWTHDSNGHLKIGWREGANRKLKLRYSVLSLIIKSYIPHVLGAADEIQEIYEDAAPVVETPTIEAGKPAEAKAVEVKHSGLEDFIAQKKREDEVKVVKKSKKLATDDKPATPVEAVSVKVDAPVFEPTPEVK